jgi:hypothetical protein
VTVGERVIEFYLHGERPEVTLPGVEFMDPFGLEPVQSAVRQFYAKYFSDDGPRVFVIGINPGRFGGGITGTPFTDPWVLREICGIETGITGQRELSSIFVYDMIARMGGPEAFYRHFLISAVLPFGLVRGGKNLNYYDERALITELTPYIVRTMWTQLEFGARRDIAIVLGTGKNYDYLARLNAEFGFFERIVPLDHPRFILQYRRKRVDEYLDRYVEVLTAAIG